MNKKTNHNFLSVVELLQGGDYHDGTRIGDTLQMTRSAVWKAVKKLRDYGISVASTKGRGYALLEPLVLLDQEYISRALKPHDVIVFESIDSTNRYLKEIKNSSHVKICLSEEQTQGRGRFNRTWVSPFGQNIYLSCLYPFKKDVGELSGLSLVVSLALLAALKAHGVHADIQIKWPNDLWYQGKKLSGTLIEMQAESHGACHAVIGIGLNVNMLDPGSDITQPWVSLRQIQGEYIDRNHLSVQLVQHLIQYLQRFDREGFAGFVSEWSQADALAGHKIEISNVGSAVSGVACGITDQGYLKLQQADGGILIISSGDATLIKRHVSCGSSALVS